jgi:hypothetical protein
VAGALGADRPAVELPRQADGELADVDHLLDLAGRLGGDLADLDAHQGGEVGLVLAQQLAEAAHQRAAHRARGPCATAGRPPAPLDGGLDVGPGLPPDRQQVLPVHR